MSDGVEKFVCGFIGGYFRCFLVFSLILILFSVSSSAPAAGTLPVSTSGPHRSPSRGGEGKNSSTCTRSDTGNLWNSSS